MSRSGNRFGRARRAEGSQARPRTPLPHPDADRMTRRMSFEELRSLVTELVEPALDDDAVDEFDTQLTTFRPTKARTSTLDELIAWLRSAPPLHSPAASPRTRRRM
ncbi:MAG TPA: hypothetical protein VGD80_00495 [Kofleriaceae bacterium]